MILPRWGAEAGRDERLRRPEQGGEEVVQVEVALTGGAHDAGEDLLGLGAAGGAIAPADLAIDDNARFILPGSVTRAKSTTPGIRLSGGASPLSTQTTVAASWWRSARCRIAPRRSFRRGCSTGPLVPPWAPVLHGARSRPSTIFDHCLTSWGFMVVLPRADATGRRMTMTTKPPHSRRPIRQLPLPLPAAMPPPEGMTRTALVGLLAQLLTSACRPPAGPEARDETR